jgi:predicted DNA-binding antitoxin AbrB/MazE fold protein
VRPCGHETAAGAAEGAQDPACHGTFVVMRVVDARYEGGILKPTQPLALTPGERVGLIVVRRPDPARWNLDRLRAGDSDDERALTEQGLADWARDLDEEDRR